ncbi:GlxA family transcriptional regulator [Taibaiella koreensis]|uniref:GlxA family transcriptional regulator n=1 Tax=Taibaiella koreensis TaxID=1268548 RepID=UPI000E59A3F2|nr:helix-turn-helix domain-containing protein [Taibaiella koreensis]
MKKVIIVVPEGPINANTIGGTLDILSRANAYWESQGNPARLEVSVAGFVKEQRSHNGYLSVHPMDIKGIRRADMVMIPALLGDYEQTIAKNKALIDWIHKRYKAGAEIASMCSGAFLLAATGLLDGQACSVHWNKLALFRELFPEVKAEAGKIITAANGIYTNGGAYSFLHLLLYLVEQLFDRTTAIFCSKIFQIDLERSSQSPFSIFETQKEHDDELIGRAQAYIEENIEERISFEKLATKLAISRRNFDRRFTKATGNTPVEYLQRVKVEAAKKELEKGRKTILEIMLDVGYNDNKAFREVFKRITGLSPLEYKNKYSKENAAA